MPSGAVDFLDELTTKPQEPVSSGEMSSRVDTGSLGISEQERDDSFAWLENLAAKQGASEGLLTKPEERLEHEPDWVQKAKEIGAGMEQPPLSGIPSQAPQPAGDVEDLGRTEEERDDSFAWLENLAAKQGASEGLLTKPEDRLEEEPDWVKQAKELGMQATPQKISEPPPTPPAVTPIPADDTAAWLRSLDEEEIKPVPSRADDETAMWLKSLDEMEAAPAVQPPQSELPAWMQNIEEEKTESIPEPTPPEEEAEELPAAAGTLEEPVEETFVPAQETPQVPVIDTGSLPSWLRGLDQEETKETVPQEELPAWLRDETGESVAEPAEIQPTRAGDWQPIEEASAEPVPEAAPAPPQPPATFKLPVEIPEPEPEPEPKPAGQPPQPRTEIKPAAPPEPYKEPVTRKGTGMLTMTVDMLLGQARNELSRSNIPGALEIYAKLIKKGRFLDEAIFDLREALYRFPVEVSIWQSLGDAYMRSNRLQDALDAYTKAEELLR
jgi:hypothetical protein